MAIEEPVTHGILDTILKRLATYIEKAVKLKPRSMGRPRSCLPSEGCTLWPPNHELREVAVVRASDAASGVVPGSFEVHATSNEPLDPSDVAVTEDGNGGLIVELRAERSGGSESRVYSLTVMAKDLAGNDVTGTASCIVPHDKGRK